MPSRSCTWLRLSVYLSASKSKCYAFSGVLYSIMGQEKKGNTVLEFRGVKLKFSGPKFKTGTKSRAKLDVYWKIDHWWFATVWSEKKSKQKCKKLIVVVIFKAIWKNLYIFICTCLFTSMIKHTSHSIPTQFCYKWNRNFSFAALWLQLMLAWLAQETHSWIWSHGHE